ncbi:MAG: hypothetical protein ACNA8K_07150 [Cyclonatronaceae bacterium]
MNYVNKAAILFFLIHPFMISVAEAQVELGVDIMSRYVWRGADFGNSPSIQPDISFSSGNFTIGTWAAIATNGNPDGSEIDWYASYAINSDAGTFSLVVTDYTFPEAPNGNYFSKSSHFMETAFAWEGTESFPLSLSTGIFVTNDDNYSIYSELGYSTGPIDLFLGFTPAKSALYGTDKAGIINTGIGTSRDVRLSEYFTFTLLGKVAVNAYANDTYFLLGFSL